MLGYRYECDYITPMATMALGKLDTIQNHRGQAKLLAQVLNAMIGEVNATSTAFFDVIFAIDN